MRELSAAGHDALPGPDGVDSLWSVGSQSAEWMDRTFAPRYREEMARTAYVTGNPFSSQSCEHILVTSGDVLPLEADDFGVFHEAWRDEWVDDDISTIPPALTDAAIAIWRNREELGIDHVLVHYMQPHAPFRSEPGWFFGSADIEHWGSSPTASRPRRTRTSTPTTSRPRNVRPSRRSPKPRPRATTRRIR